MRRHGHSQSASKQVPITKNPWMTYAGVTELEVCFSRMFDKGHREIQAKVVSRELVKDI